MNRVFRFAMAGLVAAVAGFTFAEPAAAQDANGIKYRQAVMRTNAAFAANINAILKNEAGKKEHLAGLAAGLVVNGQMIADLFAANTAMGETKAQPAIWEKKDDFAAAFNAFKTATAKLGDAAKGGDTAAIQAAMGDVGKACGGCHNPFRKQ